MKEIKYVVTDPLGIHARPAGLIVKMASVHFSWQYGSPCISGACSQSLSVHRTPAHQR